MLLRRTGGAYSLRGTQAVEAARGRSWSQSPRTVLLSRRRGSMSAAHERLVPQRRCDSNVKEQAERGALRVLTPARVAPKIASDAWAEVHVSHFDAHIQSRKPVMRQL